MYLIANSTRTEENFRNLADLNALKAMTQEDEDIHMTGIPATETVVFPQTFLMDGIAYPEGQQEPELASTSPVVLNDGVKKNDTKLAVTLRRAAAKVVVTITKGDDVTLTRSHSLMRQVITCAICLIPPRLCREWMVRQS